MFEIITPYVLFSFFSVLLNAAVALVAWTRRTQAGGKSLTGFMGAVTLWSLMATLQYSTTTLAYNLFWAKMLYLGICQLPVWYLCFALEFSGLQRYITLRNIARLSVVPLVGLALVWTNDWHGLVWPSFTRVAEGYAYARGPALLFVIAGYTYILLAVGSTLLIRAVLRLPKDYQRQVYLVIAGIALPWLLNIQYLAGLGPTAIDPTPMVMSLSGVLFLLALLQYQLLDVAPIARHTVMETMYDGIVVLDAKGRTVDYNAAALRMLGQQNELKIGARFAGRLQGLPGLAQMLEIRDPQKQLSLAVQGLEGQYLEISAAPVMIKKAGKDSAFAGQIITFHDITERKRFQDEIQQMNERLTKQLEENEQLRARLEEMAVRDELTGLFNRRYLNEIMEKEFARAQRAGYDVSVLLLDIDYFKRMNDTYGHKAGDLALVALAQFLLCEARAGDFVCRYGGEDFILVMPGLNPADALGRAGDICRGAAALEFLFDQQKLALTVSIGAAQYPQHGVTPDAVIQAADSALYCAKRNGRNQAMAAALTTN